jgi:hypothetical protein
VKAAVMDYAKGRFYGPEEFNVERILERHNVQLRSLYRWLDRLGVTRRKVQRTGKAGHPLKEPKVLRCGWCEAMLSRDQVARRRKYCCRKCQDEARAAASARPCPAPGCAAKIRDDSPYCSWACFQAVMGARFG